MIDLGLEELLACLLIDSSVELDVFLLGNLESFLETVFVVFIPDLEFALVQSGLEGVLIGEVVRSYFILLLLALYGVLLELLVSVEWGVLGSAYVTVHVFLGLFHDDL